MPTPRKKPESKPAEDRAEAPIVYVAKESAAVVVDGEEIMIRKGKTRVVSGHPLVERFGHYFERADEGGVLGVTVER